MTTVLLSFLFGVELVFVFWPGLFIFDYLSVLSAMPQNLYTPAGSARHLFYLSWLVASYYQLKKLCICINRLEQVLHGEYWLSPLVQALALDQPVGASPDMRARLSRQSCMICVMPILTIP